MRIFYFARIDLSVEDAKMRHVFEVCRQFARAGHEVFLFVPDLGHRRRVEGVTFVPVPVGVRKSSFTFFSFYFFLFFYFLYYYFRFKPDVVYTRHQQMEWLVTWLKLVLGFVYAIEVNGLSLVELKLNSAPAWIVEVTRRMEAICFRLPDLLVVPTVQIRDRLCRSYGLDPNGFLVVSNGTNPSVCRPMDPEVCREKLGLDPKGRYLLFMGSFKKWHGILEVIRIMPELAHDHPDLRLLAIGDGELRREAENLVEELGLRGRVILFGKKPYDEVPVYINAADLCLAPFFDERSHLTGLSPLKIFDYMACARPVVSNAVGGLEELFRIHGVGEAVPSDDPRSWVRAIGRLIDDPRRMREYGENGRKAVMNEFNWESVCGKIEKTLESLLSLKSK
ncbi:MAG: glycosyltransferase family 4 protein [Nitrospinae bacterium]|nr:glycosyltransferase family 4 protein [Nitrospinota bacterium]